MKKSVSVLIRVHGRRVRTRARLKMAWSIASAMRAGRDEIQSTFASPSNRKEECKKTSHAAAQRRNAGPGFRCAAAPPREKNSLHKETNHEITPQYCGFDRVERRASRECANN